MIMMKAIFVCLLVALVSHQVAATRSLEQDFEDFIVRFDKAYASPAEKAHRLRTFEMNLAEIETLNNASATATYGINQFTDMTRDELVAYKCGVPNLLKLAPGHPVPLHTVTLPSVQSQANPTAWDWTTHTPAVVTPVKDQGMCGSCWAFSTIANIEGQWALKGNPLTNLSESELVDCTKTSLGCSGGWPYWAMSDLVSAFGGKVDTEASYPYVESQNVCAFTNGTVGATISGWKSYSKGQSIAAVTEAQLEALLVSLGPLSICMNALPMQLYSSGVASPSSCDPTTIDHCVTLVGYGVDATTSAKFWKIKNSWGPRWGEAGYYRLIKGTDQPQGRCGVQTYVTSAII